MSQLTGAPARWTEFTNGLLDTWLGAEARLQAESLGVRSRGSPFVGFIVCAGAASADDSSDRRLVCWITRLPETAQTVTGTRPDVTR